MSTQDKFPDSEMDSAPNQSEAAELRSKLEAALSALSEVNYTHDGYPIYPEAFNDFTNFISQSSWHRRDYIEDMKKNLDERIETLTLDEVRSFLTMMIRIDRFNPGGLQGLLENGTARRVVDRALELV